MSILLDSGSSHTFISSALAASLSGSSSLASPVKVQVANGLVLLCESEFSSALWSTCGYEFTSDLKVLPLSSYDMILGLDWLESFSPMKVHWQQKWMAIPYNNTTVMIYANLPNLPVATVIQLCAVEVLVQDKPEVSLPPRVQALIDQFDNLFKVPTDLPPSTPCDHTIPLVDGATPVNSRAYRYPPALKDEIERQVKKMLLNEIIQPSNSPFASSILLVKKKDNSWRFCVDYRFLNAITAKSKYPVPIIDELLDELVGSLVSTYVLGFTRYA